MPSVPVIGCTPFMLFMKAEVDHLELINENIVETSKDDVGNCLLIICAIKEAAEKWKNIPEDLKMYFARSSKAFNKGSRLAIPDKKMENDILKELGSDTGFFVTLLMYRAEWFGRNIIRQCVGMQVIELFLYWNQFTKKERKKFNKLWRECTY